MKLWLLQRRNADGWDGCLGFVIRSETPEGAAENASDEGAYIWWNRDETSCTEVTVEGQPLRDFQRG